MTTTASTARPLPSQAFRLVVLALTLLVIGPPWQALAAGPAADQGPPAPPSPGQWQAPLKAPAQAPVQAPSQDATPREAGGTRATASAPAADLSAVTPAPSPSPPDARRPPQAAIASAHPLATAAGFAVLDAGGNAFDAAVAVSAALAVVEPYSSGLGGGGFWLLHRARDGREVMLDGRERSPLAAHRDMYLDADGRLVPGLSLNGPLAAAIPGEPAALAHLAAYYGRLSLAKSLAPAIRLARDGFAVDDHYRRLATWRLPVLRASPAAAAQFLEDGALPPLGRLLVQADLAQTLTRLAEAGRAGFYAGETASRLVAGVREAGGIWTLDDLASYRVVEREPVVGRYRDWRLVSAAPPSSGGVLLVQMFNMLAALDAADARGAERTHLLVEVMRRAYRDRARYLGDPDAVDIPFARLTHPYYAAGLARDIRHEWATPSVPAGRPRDPAGVGAEMETHTTHLSILDREGNRVAATLSINLPFGSGFVPPGTGVLLNDEMDDFSAQAGLANAYGLTGGEANAIGPGRRMLSSMTPTFAESDAGVAILGTPGGSRIITMVLLGLLSLDAGEGPAAWVTERRFHHQYLPDEIQYEPGAFTEAERRELAAKGHGLSEIAHGFGDMQAVYWDRVKGRVEAASDPRGIGKAEAR